MGGWTFGGYTKANAKLFSDNKRARNWELMYMVIHTMFPHVMRYVSFVRRWN